MKKPLSKLTVPSFRFLLDPNFYHVRLIYLFGSRKSAKTRHIALRIVLRTMGDSDYNALLLRKIAGDISETLISELLWAINTLGVSHLWERKGLMKGYQFTYKPTGQVILLKGINVNPVSNKPSLSGLNVPVGEIKDVWLEEAWEFSYEDWLMIRGTVRGQTGATFIIVGNPYFATMWCVKQAIELFPPVLETLKERGQMFRYFPSKDQSLPTVVHWSNLFINSKLSHADLVERLDELKRNPKDAMVTVYGYPGSPSGSILGYLVPKINHRDLDYWIKHVQIVSGGVDYAVELDATTATLTGFTPWGEFITIQGYYQSNREMTTQKDPYEMSQDIINFLHKQWRDLWQHKVVDRLVVLVDNTASAFIAILNRELQTLGIRDIIFKATKGKHDGKIPIEKRIIFEKQAMSRGLVSFLVIRNDKDEVISFPHRLLLEMENIAWKEVQSSGELKVERDGTKVHPDMTNAWEYSWRAYMRKISRYFDN